MHLAFHTLNYPGLSLAGSVASRKRTQCLWLQSARLRKQTRIPRHRQACSRAKM